MIWTGLDWIWIVNVFVALIPALSVTCTENSKVPGLEGVPPIVPFALKTSPSGRAPELTDQVYGGVPPAAASPWE